MVIKKGVKAFFKLVNKYSDTLIKFNNRMKQDYYFVSF